MDVAQASLLAIYNMCSTDEDASAIFAAQRRYFCFGVVEGTKATASSHRANLRGVVLLLNDNRLLSGEDLFALAQALASEDVAVKEVAVGKLLMAVRSACKRCTPPRWADIRRRLEEKELSHGLLSFPSNVITAETQNAVATWPSGWDAAEPSVSRGDSKELVEQEHIIRALEKSIWTVARYVPLLGIQPEEYGRVFGLGPSAPLPHPPSPDGAISDLASSDAERTWLASLTGAATVYYTEASKDGSQHVLTTKVHQAPQQAQQRTPQAQPHARPVLGDKRTRSPALPRGVVPAVVGAVRRPGQPPSSTPPSATPSNRSSGTHSDSGEAAAPLTTASSHASYIDRYEEKILLQCASGGPLPTVPGCILRNVGRFPSEIAPTPIERDIVWSCILEALGDSHQQQ